MIDTVFKQLAMNLFRLQFLALLLLVNLKLQVQELTYFEGNNKKYGYKDQNGKIVIPATYDFAEYSFTDGLAMVRNDKKYRFIDKTGKEVIPLQYQFLNKFSEGLASVRKEHGDWVFIDKTNKTALALPYYFFVSVLGDELVFS